MLKRLLKRSLVSLLTGIALTTVLQGLTYLAGLFVSGIPAYIDVWSFIKLSSFLSLPLLSTAFTYT
jgi:hypothetical protein